MVTLHNHAFSPPYGQYLPHAHNYITRRIRLQFLSENRLTLLSYSSFFLSSVHCPFSAKPMSIEFKRNNLNLVKQSHEALSAKSFHSGHLFSDHTLVNPPCSIHNRVSWSQRHHCVWWAKNVISRQAVEGLIGVSRVFLFEK